MENIEIINRILELPFLIASKVKETEELFREFQICELESDRFEAMTYLSLKAKNPTLTIKELECMVTDDLTVFQKRLECIQTESKFRASKADAACLDNEFTGLKKIVSLRETETRVGG